MVVAEPPPSLILIGPLPPPVGGATRTFAEFVDAARDRGEVLRVVDTSPGSVSRLLEPQYRVVAAGRLVRALGDHGRTVPLVWFASVGMLQRLSRLVPRAASRGPLSIVCFGGRLGEELLALPPSRRAVVVGNLAAARRVWVETRRAADEAAAAGLHNVAVLGPTRGMHGVEARLDHVPIAGRPLRLVSVGRVCRDKGVADAVALVDAADGALVLDIAGPVDAAFAGAFAELGSHHGVTYHGELEPTEVRRLLRDADASIVLSDYVGEGLPGAAIESLLVGTPVIVSRHRGLPELVRDGVDGFVVDRDPSGSWDLSSLRQRLASSDDAAWGRMRVEAATIASRCDPVEQFERVVVELMSEPGFFGGQSASQPGVRAPVERRRNGGVSGRGNHSSSLCGAVAARGRAFWLKAGAFELVPVVVVGGPTAMRHLRDDAPARRCVPGRPG